MGLSLDTKIWVQMSLPERISELPHGEPCVQPAEYRNWPYQSGCTEVAASREFLLGKEELPIANCTVIRPHERQNCSAVPDRVFSHTATCDNRVVHEA